MKPIEYQQRDGMPVEVATAMLLEPCARLTNTFRKRCQRAREKVVVSSSPIHRVLTVDEADINKFVPDTRCYAEPAERTIESKIVLRFRRATLLQLGKWRRRAISRRATVQRKYLAVPNSEVPTLQAQFDAAREALSLLAERLDIIRDCAEDEINRRASKCNEIEVIRPLFRSVVYFRVKPTTPRE